MSWPAEGIDDASILPKMRTTVTKGASPLILVLFVGTFATLSLGDTGHDANGNPLDLSDDDDHK